MRRIFGVLAGVLALFLPFLQATPAQADGTLAPVTSIPLPRMYADTSLIAASGDTLVRQVKVSSREFVHEYSRNNGRTWQQLPDTLAGQGSLVGYQGVFYKLELTDLVTSDEGCDTARLGGFVVWEPATGAQRKVAVTAEQSAVVSECLRIRDAVSNRVVLNDGRVFDLSGATAQHLPVRFGTGAPADATPQAISADGRTVAARASGYDAQQHERTYLVVAPTDGTEGPAAIHVPGLLDIAVSANRVHYLVGTKTRLQVCRAALATPAKPSCVTLRKGDSRYLDLSYEVSQGVDQVTHWTGGKGGGVWFSQGSRVRKLTSTGTIRRPQGTGFRDPSRPLAAAVHASRGVVYGRLTKGLKVSWSIIGRKVPSQVGSLALAPNRVLAIDSRPYPESAPNPLWYRTFAAGGIGKEVRLTGPVDAGWNAFASGARSAADCCTSLRTKYYDGAKRTFNQRQKSNLMGLSGPYAATQDFVRRVDGTRYDTGLYPAVFGSLVATLNEESRTVTIRDLARPSATPLSLTLPAGPEYWAGDLRIWGDWIAVSSGYPEVGYTAQVINYRTQESHAIDGKVEALGDGHALVFHYGPPAPGLEEDSRTVELWNVATGEKRPVPVATGFRVAIDGVGQVAWVTETTIEVATLPGTGTSRPRLLGMLAPSSFRAGRAWRPELDTTKPLKAGTLEIRNANGVLVRSIATRATASGSLRGLQWNGRDAKGRKVAPGSYTWTLRAEAADGTGPVADVAGLGEATGTVKVKR